ncbi:uncharacterized protein L201_007099 [Kwoniella dendrophila CBS 6074]|uniref:Transmembrane protein 188 n=1 Tax=Kwoniella dendrophila CBS 6074 TaxID=1295534 RepID=A0AAX4K5R3_9TREE
MSTRNTISSNPSTGSSTPVRPHPSAPYHPPADTATYRDLLLFEERLKSNAEMLRRRRQRYNVFLYTFIMALACMAYKLFIRPPKSNLRIRALQATVAVVSVTLVLFFASGMYEEKIKYAHSYINHSNKALRPLNMHLNMRRPKTSLFSFIPFFRSSTSSPTPSTSSSSSTPTPPTQSGIPSNQLINKPFLGGRGQSSQSQQQQQQRKVSNSTNVMATIPPSTNPRGELIFSSRVDRNFREGYERYRAAFERRREEKAREESKLNMNSTKWLSWTTSTSSSSSHNRTGSKSRRSDSPSPAPSPLLNTGSNGKNTPLQDITPPLTRKQTPDPPSSSPSNLSVNSSINSNTIPNRRRSPSPGESNLRNSIKPILDDIKLEKPGRERSESYSFLLNQNQNQNKGKSG